MESKIKFKDLSGWLKVAVVTMWVVGGWYATFLLIGIVLGTIGLFYY
ncbi:MAG: hypothetical protein KAQ92_03125 [Candidatus Aenigmarchaeota archaeon]|nr:hypothetical protein [Candidatus Aenigmarchaeota archaeon]